MIEIRIRSDDGQNEVRFYDADRGGDLRRLADHSDSMLLRKEIARRIELLHSGATIRSSHSDEVVEKFVSMQGERVSVVVRGVAYHGSVVRAYPHSRTVLLKGVAGLAEVSIPSFDEEEQDLH